MTKKSPDLKYTLAQLKNKARRLDAVVKREMGEYTVRLKGAPLSTTYFTQDSADAWNTMCKLRADATEHANVAPLEFNLVLMNGDGKIIDQYTNVHASDTNQDSTYHKPLMHWLMRAIAVGGEMHRDGSIKRMPALTKAEGARTNLYKLRRELYEMTHNDDGTCSNLALWGKIRALLDLFVEIA